MAAENADALARAMLSLEGLSCGDAFGENFFLLPSESRRYIETRTAPPPPWHFTDDTLMAISIVENLRVHGKIVQDALAGHFARLYNPFRGYGRAMNDLLPLIATRGADAWRQEAPRLFSGAGSFGNGSAMRVPPLGAYFADDYDKVVEQAALSAAPTHCHEEAIAGAIATALGAAIAWRTREDAAPSLHAFLETIIDLTPQSEVRHGIARARQLQSGTSVHQAAAILGNGSKITAMDTVPFVLWTAGTFLDTYEEALWQTVSAFGDKDTTCAMAGGIVVMRTGFSGIPAEWHRRRELLGPMFTAA